MTCMLQAWRSETMTQENLFMKSATSHDLSVTSASEAHKRLGYTTAI